LVDYGFTGKGAYVRLGRVSYVSELIASLSSLLRPASRASIYWRHQFVLPLPALAFIVYAFVVKRQRDPRSVVVVLFAGAGWASVFPRGDARHLTIALPMLMIATAHAWPAVRADITRQGATLVRSLASAWLVVGLAVLTFGIGGRAISARYTWSNLPHFTGMLIDREAQRGVARAVGQMRANAANGAMFVVSPRAGFYYLISGLRNPTPYDYPLVTTFGRHGEEETVRAIVDGRIKAACVDPSSPQSLRAVRVENAMRQHMRPVIDAGPCIVYSAIDAK
jgi:hypothetical protein